jgi:hypothetical protein
MKAWPRFSAAPYLGLFTQLVLLTAEVSLTFSLVSLCVNLVFQAVRRNRPVEISLKSQVATLNPY